MRLAVVALCVAVLALAGCSKSRAVTRPDLPSLVPPSPPPRVVAPPEPEVTVAPPVVTPPADPAKPPVRRAAPKPDPPKPDPSKPVVTTPAREEPPPTLQTTSPGTPAEVERQTRTLLAQAIRDLGRVKPEALNADLKAQYDSAKRFIDQAQQALKEQNFTFALRLADKAATLAAGLSGGRLSKA